MPQITSLDSDFYLSKMNNEPNNEEDWIVRTLQTLISTHSTIPLKVIRPSLFSYETLRQYCQLNGHDRSFTHNILKP